jgi:hypothetical protein
MESHVGARLLRGSLPSMASVAADEFARGREALAAVPMKTEPGSTCRQAALRLAARSETLYRSLAADVAVMRESWHAVALARPLRRKDARAANDPRRWLLAPPQDYCLRRVFARQTGRLGGSASRRGGVARVRAV